MEDERAKEKMKMCGVCAHNLTLFIRGVRTVSELEDFQRVILHELATLIQRTWRGWIKRRRFNCMRRSQMIIAFSYRNWKRRCYLYWLSRHLPSESPLCREWPSAPWLLHDANYYLRKYYHRWRCLKYRNRLDQTTRDRMREKVTASLLFRDRKMSYIKSVLHPFRGDYVRLRQNVKWKKVMASESCSSSSSGGGSSDQNYGLVVFADIVNKITRSSGKCVQKLLVVSTCDLLVIDHRTLQVKYRIPISEIFRLSLSPFQDDIVVVHVICTDTSKRKGAFVFESAHVIEIVTKLFLVIQNSTGIPIEVQIVSEFEANFGKENVLVLFRCTGPPESFQGPARITRKSAKLEVVL